MSLRGAGTRSSVLRHPYVAAGLAVLGVVAIGAVGANLLAPYPITTVDLRAQLQGPSPVHWLGTDENGRDVLSLLLHGARVALIVGLASVSISVVGGVALGSVSGYVGGRLDDLLMRLTDIAMAFPGFLLAILILFVAGEPGLLAVILALSLTGYARLVRGQVLAEREREYVEAARALGFAESRVLLRHVLPNTVAPLLVQATFGVAGTIIAEASLSFLGLGPQDHVSWGALLDQGVTYFLLTPHLAIAPGVAIAVTVLGINFLGDGLRDVLDPRDLV